MGDPERYRKPEEVKQWQENDPIGIFHDYLTKDKKATKAELTDIEVKVDEEVEAAVEFAEKSPDPAPEELFKDIYVEEV
jgi:pyruvate dehydrogenase E1 component alpha subunit